MQHLTTTLFKLCTRLVYKMNKETYSGIIGRFRPKCQAFMSCVSRLIRVLKRLKNTRGSAGPALRRPFSLVPVRRSAGLLVRCAGPLVRCAGPLVRWSAGPLRWSAGPPVRWSAGPLVRWSAAIWRRVAVYTGRTGSQYRRKCGSAAVLEASWSGAEGKRHR